MRTRCLFGSTRLLLSLAVFAVVSALGAEPAALAVRRSSNSCGS
jgi:hypothetical protein